MAKCLECIHWKPCFNGKDWDATIATPCEYFTTEPERPKGRWILKKEWHGGRWHKWYECSRCGEKDDNYEMYEAMPFAGGLSNFCPNCGADMRGESNGC